MDTVEENRTSCSQETDSSTTLNKVNDDKTLDYFIDESTWDAIGKDLQDFAEEDMMKLSFPSLDSCLQFYRIYAKVTGFGIRKCGAARSRIDNHPTSQRCVCNKEGKRSEKWLKLKNRVRNAKSITRCGCKAEIRFKLSEDSKYWFVTNFIAEHNHELAKPIHIPFIRSNRNFIDADVKRIKMLYKAGMNPNDAWRVLLEQAGSNANVGFLLKDLYNLWERIKKEEVKYGDAETVMAYLSGKKISDPSFFYSYTKDEEDRLEKLFWCDRISRIDYKAFGHVIAFDTTYKSNAYNKPFVVIVGINNHRKTVPFGCALVVDEKEESFIWVLNQLITAGSGMKPHTVITDGDKAMAKAIKEVLPEARHRLCLWHLMRNVKANGGKRFASGFMKCVDRCQTPSDFEEAWNELVTHHGVQHRKWATDLYNDKEKWAEAFMRGQFFAGMRSTQRCESMHRTVKRVLDKKIMLYRFLELYDEVLNGLRFTNNNLDYNCLHSDIQIDGVLSNIKTHASKVYTRNSYSILLKEIQYEAFFVVRRVEKDISHPEGPVSYYWLEELEKPNSWYLVIQVSQIERMYCCCMKLESIGYPCRHMFSVMKHERLTQIPRGCILKRWTIHAKEQIGFDEPIDEIDDDDERIVMARFAYLSSFASKICYRAVKSLKSFNDMKDIFAKLIANVPEEDVNRNKKKATKRQKLGIGDPQLVTGRGKPKKQKSRHLNKTTENKNGEQNDFREGEAPTDFDLNHSPKASPSKTNPNESTDDVHNSSFQEIIKDFMPRTYFSGEVSKSEYSHEVWNLEQEPTVVDWDPSNIW